MSNSWSPKKPSSVFTQETLEKVLVVLRQPLSMAVLASLAAHGLLWAALPTLLTNTEKEPDTKRRVQTVELSPAEQSQLPSFGIDQVPQTLLPTKPSQPLQSATKLPDPKLYNDPSLYNFPLLAPPPPIVFPSLGFPPSFDFKPSPAAKPRQSKPPTGQATTPPKPPENSNSTKPSTNPTQPTVDPAVPVRPDKLSPAQLTALRQEGERSSQLRTLYAFNGPDTLEKATGALKANGADFIESAKKITGGDADDSRLYKTPERVTASFPKDACPFVRGVRNASFGAIVKPDGTLAESPAVLLTSGFKGLDNVAIEDIANTIKNKKFGDGSKFQLIRFDFLFDPKTACSNSDKPA